MRSHEHGAGVRRRGSGLDSACITAHARFVLPGHSITRAALFAGAPARHDHGHKLMGGAMLTLVERPKTGPWKVFDGRRGPKVGSFGGGRPFAMVQLDVHDPSDELPVGLVDLIAVGPGCVLTYTSDLVGNGDEAPKDRVLRAQAAVVISVESLDAGPVAHRPTDGEGREIWWGGRVTWRTAEGEVCSLELGCVPNLGPGVHRAVSGSLSDLIQCLGVGGT